MICKGTIEEAYGVFIEVPELDRGLSLGEFKSKAPAGALVLLCRVEEKSVGFKIGYPISENEFYSWLGGVLPEYREQGVAQQLLDSQERWVRNQGYTKISVKSMNRYSSMIRFLVKNGYQIVKVGRFGTKDERIHFQKSLA